MALGLELAEPDLPDQLLDGDQVADDLAWTPFAGRGRLGGRRAGSCRELAGNGRKAGTNGDGIRGEIGHGRIVGRTASRCDTRPAVARRLG
jgi:hypothetical protein